MPVDSSIALGIQPIQVPNPLAQYAQVMGIKNASNQNALTQYSLAKAQRDQQVQNALGQSLAKNQKPDGTVDWNLVKTDVANSGYPDAIPTINSMVLGQQEKEAQIGKTTAEAGKATAETGQIQAGARAQAAAALWQNPTNEAILRMYAVAPKASNGQDNIALATQLLAEPGLNNRKQILTQAAMLHPQGREALQAVQPKIEYQDIGGMKVPVNTSALGGPVGPYAGASPIAKSMTPGEVASNAVARYNATKPIYSEAQGAFITQPGASGMGGPGGGQPGGPAQAGSAPQVIPVPGAVGTLATQRGAEIRGEQTKALAPIEDIQQKVTRMKQLLANASDNPAATEQVQQGLTDIFESTRPYSQLLNMNSNFGTLMGRMAGFLSEKTGGVYTDEQRKRVSEMVNDMESNVLSPTRQRITQYHQQLAAKSGVPAELVAPPNFYQNQRVVRFEDLK